MHIESRRSLLDLAEMFIMKKSNYYHPHTKYGEGNLFTGVCSRGERGSASSQHALLVTWRGGLPTGEVFPPGGICPTWEEGADTALQIQSSSGWYKSYWNASLFTMILGFPSKGSFTRCRINRRVHQTNDVQQWQRRFFVLFMAWRLQMICRMMWIHPLNELRFEKGEFYTLYLDLRHFGPKFFNIHVQDVCT